MKETKKNDKVKNWFSSKKLSESSRNSQVNKEKEILAALPYAWGRRKKERIDKWNE